jgi:hypothetical protein
MTRMQLESILGRKVDKIDDMTARCIRALVLKPDVRKVVTEARICFPDATFEAIRTVASDDTGT